MNNAKKLLICISVLFITLLFQVAIIIKLNILDNRLDTKIAYASSLNKDDNSVINNDIEDDNQNTSDNNTTNNSDIDNTTDNYDDKPLSDDIITEQDYSSILSNSLFIGDSRTEGIRKFTVASMYSHFCCDVGISINDIMSKIFFIGDNNTNLIDAITNNKYKNIFICVGYNELGWDYEDVFIQKYSELIDSIKEINPSTKIYVQAILNISQNANVYEEGENNDRINLYNSKIEEMCIEKDVSFINLNSEFTDENGYLMEITTEDGIHFTSEYYNKYLEKLILNLK